MKVVFVDVDGVLNSGSTLCKGIEFYPDFMNNLKELVTSTNSKIVLSSSWRNFIAKDPSGIFKPKKSSKSGMSSNGEELLTQFSDYGLSVYDTISSVELSQCNRGKEILSWLQDNSNVVDFVILDDCLFDFEDCNLLDRVVRTNSGEYRNTPFEVQGFNKAKLKEAINILNKGN